MGTTILKNTGIKDLIAVSRGDWNVLQRMTKEFRELVEGFPLERPNEKVEKPLLASAPIECPHCRHRLRIISD